MPAANQVRNAEAKISTIQAYETADGRLHRDPQVAAMHAQHLAFVAALDAWVEKNCTYNMDKRDIARALYEGRETLAVIFRYPGTHADEAP